MNIEPRRAGDVATSFADNARAVAELDWQPQYGLEDMLKDSWNWQKQNPNGYDGYLNLVCKFIKDSVANFVDLPYLYNYLT